MSDIAINALPAGSGNMLSTDRIPVDKYNGGPYITVYRTGQEIMNAITSLSTATFTNINTSINNAITTAYNNVLNYYDERILTNSTTVPAVTTNHVIFTYNINPANLAFPANTIYQFSVTFDIFATDMDSTIKSKIGKYIVSYTYSDNDGLTQVGSGTQIHLVNNNTLFSNNINLFSNISSTASGWVFEVKATNYNTDYINTHVKATVMYAFSATVYP